MCVTIYLLEHQNDDDDDDHDNGVVLRPVHVALQVGTKAPDLLPRGVPSFTSVKAGVPGGDLPLCVGDVLPRDSTQ